MPNFKQIFGDFYIFCPPKKSINIEKSAGKKQENISKEGKVQGGKKLSLVFYLPTMRLPIRPKKIMQRTL